MTHKQLLSSNPMLQVHTSEKKICAQSAHSIRYVIRDMNNVNQIVFRSLKGLKERVNDIIFVPASISTCSSTIIYFGGDVQTFEETMMTGKNAAFRKWSLEATASILANANPDKAIVIVHPRELAHETFSCFSNFVKTDALGSPQHDFDIQCAEHLEALMDSLANACAKFDPRTSKILIGFSKGVVVLNQLLHELDRSDSKMLKEIVKMCWFDGGHNGGQKTWITDEALLKSLVARNIEVDIRVTPYQIHDDHRPWIGQEEKKFSRTLARLGANVSREVYFEDKTPIDIEDHFQVLLTVTTKQL